MIALPPRDVVHLWHANLDCNTSDLQRLEKLLSQDEAERAARYRFSRDRDLFVAARALLRETLAFYLKVPAMQLRFAYGAWGKPSLAEHPSLCFNLSHCGNRALVVVAHECEVGVDIERVRTDLQISAMADLVFCEAEKSMLRQLAGDARQETFFQLWTRKEAYIKADGRGVSWPLTHIDVSNLNGDITTLDEQTEKWQVSSQWCFRTVDVGSGYAAAVVAQRQEWKIEVIGRSMVDWPHLVEDG